MLCYALQGSGDIANGRGGAAINGAAPVVESKPPLKRAAGATQSAPPKKAPRLDIPEQGLHQNTQVRPPPPRSASCLKYGSGSLLMFPKPLNSEHELYLTQGS